MESSGCREGVRCVVLAGSIVFASGLSGCLCAATGLEPTAAAGAAEAAGKRLGRFEVASIGAPPGTITPTTCIVGDHELFLGADLVDPKSNLVVRLVVDPLAGPALRVYDADSPFDRSVVFFRDECTTFRMKLEDTGTMVNNIVERRLDLKVECENEDGATIRGSAAVARCD
ncbi:MAG: hypothetical protein ABI689_01915 [Thermoanaerobaculia bacterium]